MNILKTSTDTAGEEPRPEAPAYHGWFRPSRGMPYARVVSGTTYDAAWGALLDWLAQHRQRGGDSVVLPRDQDAIGARLCDDRPTPTTQRGD